MARSLLRASSGSQKALSMMYLTAADRFDGVMDICSVCTSSNTGEHLVSARSVQHVQTCLDDSYFKPWKFHGY